MVKEQNNQKISSQIFAGPANRTGDVMIPKPMVYRLYLRGLKTINFYSLLVLLLFVNRRCLLTKNVNVIPGSLCPFDSASHGPCIYNHGNSFVFFARKG